MDHYHLLVFEKEYLDDGSNLIKQEVVAAGVNESRLELAEGD